MNIDEAISYGESGEWNWLSDQERAALQLEVEYSCMPFNIFHHSIEKALGRPVFTHEFGLDWDGLKQELHGERPTATFKQVMDLMMKTGKPVVIAMPDGEGGFTMTPYSP